MEHVSWKTAAESFLQERVKYEQMVSACGREACDNKQVIPGFNKTHIEGDFLSPMLVHAQGILVV